MATITGTSGNDLLNGTIGDDTITGLAGDDLLPGGDGDDTIYGGPGNDGLSSFPFLFDEGDDVAYGGAGDDFFGGVEFSEEGGDDWMDGGPGNDVFDYTIPLTFFREGVVPIGNDIIVGGSGTDRVQFSDPSPFTPSPSANLFHGTTTAAVVVDLENGTFNTAAVSGTIVGVEEIMGSNFDDTILGSKRAESLSGSHGNDHIEGRGGNDRVDGGFGLNTLNGGAGADEFVFNAFVDWGEPFPINAGLNVIEDFTPRKDELVFDNSAFDAVGAEGKWKAGDERFYAAAGATSGHDANDRLVYNTTTGDLYYDADGNGSIEALLVATLEEAPTLVASDITVL